MKKYPNMKNVEIEWIDKLPEHWNVKRLKFSVKNKNKKSNNSKLPYVGLENVESGTGLLLSVDHQMEESEGKIIEKNDILFGKLRPYLSKVTKIDFYGRCSGEFLVLNGIDYLPNFLQKLLISDVSIKIIDSSTHGAKMPRAEWSFIGNMKFPIPTLNEQKQIAKFLEKNTTKINSDIQKNQELIEFLKEKRQSTINRAVTKGLDTTVSMEDSGIDLIGKIPKHWEFKKIKRDSIVNRGASPRPIDDPKYFDVNGKYSWVRISDVTSSKGFLKQTEQKLSDLGASLSVKLDAGELFLSIAGSVGKQCITEIPCCIHDGFVYFPRLTILKKFLYYIFELGECYKGLGKLGTQLNLNTETVGNIFIPIPPKTEQKKIIDYLDDQISKIDSLISKIESQIKNLQNLRQSLVTSTVTGKIDVRGVVI